jgi:hypothetical protein
VASAVARKLTRDVDEDIRDHFRALANTNAFEQSRRERKKIEMRFAHMKRIFKLDRLRLRGLSGARDEVLLTATAQKPETARQVPLPCSATSRNCRPSVSAASGVGIDTPMPRLSQRESVTSLAADSNRVLQHNPR